MRPAGPDPVQGYAPLPGVPDEMMDAQGRIRPVWRPFIAHLQAMGRTEMLSRFDRGNEYLRDAGVFYRQYGAAGSVERAWPLSHVPVMVADAEWQALARGLAQRADLLERVVADLYGAQTLIAEGHLPASLIAASPEWLRPLVGVTPRGGHFLNFVAFEIGRGPDGGWWVLGDRTQAPSGAGFALENRVATSRIYADFYADAHVHRLAGFFRDFRATLDRLNGDARGRPAILTPGPLNDTYYEHAYIARYLGLSLLEGEDLTVEGGKVMVRTVAGPRPVNVLWRRLDANWVDRLELDERSALGSAGLVQAAREGTVAMVNALGTGVLETRALMTFLPRISQILTGAPLAIPNIATWWCGDAQARDLVRAQAGRMTISPALATRPSVESRADEVAGWMRSSAGDSLDIRLARDGALLVGQETVTLSTTPAQVMGRLEPRPAMLRVFLARTEDGWQVMPGGYARIGRRGDPSALAMQRGGSVADVWVVADAPVPATTLLAQRSGTYARPEPGMLPARAADNLFWLGRYVERAEGQMRLLRAWHARLAESGDSESPLLAHIATHLRWLGLAPTQPVPDALIDTIRCAVNAAGKVRDRFSIDGWSALDDLARSAQGMTRTARRGQDAASAMGVLLRKITGFSGLVHDNMYRFTGWRFLTIGRSLERAAGMASLLATFADPGAPDGALDLVVEVGDSTMSHRRRHAIATTRETVVDLLALDPLNPRSVLYHLDELKGQIDMLPGSDQHGRLTPLTRAMLQLQTGLAIRAPEDLPTPALITLQGDLAALSDLLSEACLR